MPKVSREELLSLIQQAEAYMPGMRSASRLDIYMDDEGRIDLREIVIDLVGMTKHLGHSKHRLIELIETVWPCVRIQTVSIESLKAKPKI